MKSSRGRFAVEGRVGGKVEGKTDSDAISPLFSLVFTSRRARAFRRNPLKVRKRLPNSLEEIAKRYLINI